MERSATTFTKMPEIKIKSTKVSPNSTVICKGKYIFHKFFSRNFIRWKFSVSFPYPKIVFFFCTHTTIPVSFSTPKKYKRKEKLNLPSNKIIFIVLVQISGKFLFVKKIIENKCINWWFFLQQNYNKGTAKWIQRMEKKHIFVFEMQIMDV